MNELVYRKENQVLTNSRLVAMKFGKRHSDVIRAIEDLLIKLPENERKRNFAQLEEDVEISNGGSKKLKFYAMTETGFTLLVMGFTGEKAIQFKLEYIAAFNKMKEIIKRASLPSYQIDDPIKRAEKWIEEQKEKKALETKVEELSIENKEMEKRIEEDTPKVIFAMAVTESKRSCLVAELAKIICQNGIEVGQNRLFKWLRKKGYLGTKGEYYNQPMQMGRSRDVRNQEKNDHKTEWRFDYSKHTSCNRKRASVSREQVLERIYLKMKIKKSPDLSQYNVTF